MNSYYESILRKSIFPNQKEKVEIVINVYDSYATERNYISMVLNEWEKGTSDYETRRRLEHNIVDVYLHIRKREADRIEEFKRRI